MSLSLSLNIYRESPQARPDPLTQHNAQQSTAHNTPYPHTQITLSAAPGAGALPRTVDVKLPGTWGPAAGLTAVTFTDGAAMVGAWCTHGVHVGHARPVPVGSLLCLDSSVYVL